MSAWDEFCDRTYAARNPTRAGSADDPVTPEMVDAFSKAFSRAGCDIGEGSQEAFRPAIRAGYRAMRALEPSLARPLASIWLVPKDGDPWHQEVICECGWTGKSADFAGHAHGALEPPDDSISFIRAVGEELVEAGYPAGDRAVVMANLRDALRRLRASVLAGHTRLDCQDHGR